MSTVPKSTELPRYILGREKYARDHGLQAHSEVCEARGERRILTVWEGEESSFRAVLVPPLVDPRFRLRADCSVGIRGATRGYLTGSQSGHLRMEFWGEEYPESMKPLDGFPQVQVLAMPGHRYSEHVEYHGPVADMLAAGSIKEDQLPTIKARHRYARTDHGSWESNLEPDGSLRLQVRTDREEKDDSFSFENPTAYRNTILKWATAGLRLTYKLAAGTIEEKETGNKTMWLHAEALQRLMELQGTVLSVIENAEICVPSKAPPTLVKDGNVIQFPQK